MVSLSQWYAFVHQQPALAVLGLAVGLACVPVLISLAVILSPILLAAAGIAVVSVSGAADTT